MTAESRLQCVHVCACVQCFHAYGLTMFTAHCMCFYLSPLVCHTGDINEEYLARLESQGRGASRQRPGQKASLLGNGTEAVISSARGSVEPAAV